MTFSTGGGAGGALPSRVSRPTALPAREVRKNGTTAGRGSHYASAMIRVVVIEDEATVRQQLIEALRRNPEVDVVGEADEGVRGMTLLHRLRPDVALLDLRLRGREGLELLRALATRADAPRILALTTLGRQADVDEAVRLGARGVLLKEWCVPKLGAALRRVLAGEVVLEMPELPVTAAGETAPEALTPKEREVLRLMCAGLSNREIAQAIGRVEGTVKNHVSTILAKLGVRQRTQAVLRAIGAGLV